MVRKKKHPQSRAERLIIDAIKKARTQEVSAKKRPPKKEAVNEDARIYVVEEAVGGATDRVPSS